MGVAKIVVARDAGFCTGVRRAVLRAEAAAQEDAEETVVTVGPLVHNRQVTDQLRSLGVNPVEKLNEAAGRKAIIRTHGLPPEHLVELESLGAKILDLTCPYVKRIHSIVARLSREGYQVLIVGDRTHPEVIGSAGWAGKGALIAGTPEEVEELPLGDRVGVVAQTTQTRSNWEAVLERVRARAHEVKVYDTICSATVHRQEGARELSGQVELIIVVGGKNSSNTRKLSQICAQTGVPAYHVESWQEIEPRWLEGVSSVGITAGASTPDWVLKEVIGKVDELGKKETVSNDNVFDGDQQMSSEPAETSQTPHSCCKEPDSENETCATAESTLVAAPAGEPYIVPGPAGDDGREVDSEAIEMLESALRTVEGTTEQSGPALPPVLQEGEIISGEVMQVIDDGALVAVGAKTEGFIPQNEISTDPSQRPEEALTIGQTIEVMVLKAEDKEGRPLLSKKRADYERLWAQAEEVLETRQPVQVNVTKMVKGGLLATFGLVGFIPASHVSKSFVPDLSTYVGKSFPVQIIEIDRPKKKLVFSHRNFLEEEQKRTAQKTWTTLEPGQILTGKVKNITDFGVFVDVGGIDGLVHISEMAWGRIRHPSELVTEGQEITVKVLGVDRERERISLGLKQVRPDPWENVAEKFPLGSTVTGRVVSLAQFGAFVEVEPGVEGLVHISQLAPRRINKPEEAVTVGQEVQAKVLQVNTAQRRLSLSLRAIEEDADRQTMNRFNSENVDTGVTLGDVFGGLFEGNHNKFKK